MLCFLGYSTHFTPAAGVRQKHLAPKAEQTQLKGFCSVFIDGSAIVTSHKGFPGPLKHFHFLIAI